MKRKEMIKAKREFTYIIKNCPFIKNNFFIVYFKNNHNNEYTHFGIAISKKVGNAVIRNKLKRQIRNIIDEYKILFPKNKDYIIMIKKTCAFEKYGKLKENLFQIIKEIK